jgi:GTP1/Obg family GTP-binding protein
MELQISAGLAERVQEHLSDEERNLVSVLEAVRQLHQSLRDLDGEALAQALQHESTALRDAEAMQQQRQQIRNDAARELGLDPNQCTLGLLARTTSGRLQSSIVESRDKLTSLSAEMDRLNRQNAAMIQQSLMLMRGIVGRLTGTVASGESYNASGGRADAHVGSLVQWGG